MYIKIHSILTLKYTQLFCYLSDPNTFPLSSSFLFSFLFPLSSFFLFPLSSSFLFPFRPNMDNLLYHIFSLSLSHSSCLFLHSLSLPTLYPFPLHILPFQYHFLFFAHAPHHLFQLILDFPLQYKNHILIFLSVNL